MKNRNFGQNNEQILKDFRRVASSYVEHFNAFRNHIYDLLGREQNYSSGIFREGLLIEFLRNLLPTSMSIDSGFIYGFGEEKNSKQIDILIWDSSKHSAVYKTSHFVIVPPESVIVAISVKSNLNRTDIEDGLTNLLSTSLVDITYRGQWLDEKEEPLIPAITKILISYKGNIDYNKIGKEISEYFIEYFKNNEFIMRKLLTVLRDINIFQPSILHTSMYSRIFPSMVLAFEDEPVSYTFGWGPPNDIEDRKEYANDIKRLPYVYPQESIITTFFEKFIYRILVSVYRHLGNMGTTMTSAWGDFNPILGSRIGDAYEIIEKDGMPLIDPQDFKSEIE